MPVHDWSEVESGIFHDFHHAWIEEIKRTLNRGLLPQEYYALAEQYAGGMIPDVLTLGRKDEEFLSDDAPGNTALATTRPQTRFHAKAEIDIYAEKAKSVVIRHRSGHEIVAMIEIVSPGNMNSRHGLAAFVQKSAEALRAGIHLLIVDLFPPGPRDPQGMHKAIWNEFIDNDFALPADKPLTLAAYVGGMVQEAFIEPVAVNDTLPPMPVFLTLHAHVLLPLEATYQSAWDAVPAYWQTQITKSRRQ